MRVAAPRCGAVQETATPSPASTASAVRRRAARINHTAVETTATSSDRSHAAEISMRPHPHCSNGVRGDVVIEGRGSFCP